jgi:CRP-like cAMP-binding protein
MATKTKATGFGTQSYFDKPGSIGTSASYSTNRTVFAQGDSADSVFYIEKGKVQVSVLSERGSEGVLAILGLGDFFGEGSLSGQLRRMASVVTITDCSIVRVERAAMEQALLDEPGFADLFVSHLLRRGVRAEGDMIDQLFNSSEERLARILLLLANFGKGGKPQPIIPHVSQKTLAQMIGTTRSRVSFFMNKFKRLGFIDYNGTIDVHSGTIHVHGSLLNVVQHEAEPKIR